MTALPTGSDAALAPLRTALAATAAARIVDIEQAAQADADALLRAAAGERERILAEATEAGTLEARAAAALVSARSRRAADELLLARREAVRARLGARVQVAATALISDPRYPEIMANLTNRAHRVLGPDAIITTHDVGGITATAGSRTLDLTLPTLAARTLDSMSSELESLWMA